MTSTAMAAISVFPSPGRFEPGGGFPHWSASGTDGSAETVGVGGDSFAGAGGAYGSCRGAGSVGMSALRRRNETVSHTILLGRAASLARRHHSLFENHADWSATDAVRQQLMDSRPVCEGCTP